MSTASEQLRAALASADSFQTWLKDRGFVPVADAPQVPAKQSLRDAQHYHSPEQPRAPYLLALYNERWNDGFKLFFLSDGETDHDGGTVGVWMPARNVIIITKCSGRDRFSRHLRTRIYA